jgi:hypothetical protein
MVTHARKMGIIMVSSTRTSNLEKNDMVLLVTSIIKVSSYKFIQI